MIGRLFARAIRKAARPKYDEDFIPCVIIAVAAIVFLWLMGC